ncbi:MAG TPA: dehydrogenase [Sphaerochaeta sp.]|nr:MAG: hypothetical protein A2Y31_11545 [Spirochaetes bacterium GWC2_52_13]HCG62713.1 dehydrogenase [Sphaerochaeta sp.]HCS36340.1 dehydrogenase [Sphaerochaeta sp.]
MGKDYCEQVSFPPIRKATVDLLSVAVHKHMIHGMIEVDVTDCRSRFRAMRTQGKEIPSLTSYIIYCCAKVVSKDKMLHAYRTLGNRLVLFDDVDVSLPIERSVNGQLEVVPSIVRAANSKTVGEISREIGQSRQLPMQGNEMLRGMRLFLLIPGVLRRLLFRLMGRMPRSLKDKFGTVMVTSVGMFGHGAGWGFPIATHTLNIAIGSIVKRLELVGGGVKQREFLCLTVSFDHDIVDGAPAARFIYRLKRMVERCEGLE